MVGKYQKQGVVYVSIWYQAWNTVLCVALTLVLFGIIRKNVYCFPITVEVLWQISLAEMNRRRSKRRTRKMEQQLDSDDSEKQAMTEKPATKFVASIVGYREDPTVFVKCLESFKIDAKQEILFVGIDGNDAQDLEMANIVRKVYGKNAIFIDLEESFGNIVSTATEQYVVRELTQSGQQKLLGNWILDDLSQQLRDDASTFAMDQAYAKATEVLERNNVLSSYDSHVRVVCITQPHINKKGILFTNLILSTVWGKANHVSYLWTGDSDTWVMPETVPLTIGCMAADPKIGGSCSLLGVHNGHESYVAQLGAAVYWCELAITRGQTAVIDSADCQPGPCAAFFLDALSPQLFDWYTQTSFGVKTIVNEDRHLTTKLLLNGWKVTFCTDAIAFTDTPTTLLRWLLQQIRWARATQIETFQYPAVYAIHGPIFFFASMNRFYGPLSLIILTLRYVVWGQVVRAYSIYDILLRVLLVITYNRVCYPREIGCSLLFLAFSQLFYQLPLPGLILYASFTALEGGWGTSMRNRKEVQKAKGTGWNHISEITAVVSWMGVVGAAFARWIGNSLNCTPSTTLCLMWSSALSVMAVLYYVLLKKSQRA